MQRLKYSDCQLEVCLGLVRSDEMVRRTKKRADQDDEYGRDAEAESTVKSIARITRDGLWCDLSCDHSDDLSELLQACHTGWQDGVPRVQWWIMAGCG